MAGIPMALGTGSFKLLFNTGATSEPKIRKTVFDTPEYHVPHLQL